MKKLSIAFMAAVSLLSFAGCKKKAGNDAAAAIAKLTEFKDAMCKCSDKACAEKVQADMQKWAAEMSSKKESAKPSEADMQKSQAVTEELTKCTMKAMGVGAEAPAAGSAEAPAAGSAEAPAAGSADSAAAPAAGGAAAADLPAECNDYKGMIEKLANCDKMPQASRDALKQAFDQASTAWASVPADGKAALASGCKAAADGLKQTAASVCGW